MQRRMLYHGEREVVLPLESDVTPIALIELRGEIVSKVDLMKILGANKIHGWSHIFCACKQTKYNEADYDEQVATYLALWIRVRIPILALAHINQLEYGLKFISRSFFDKKGHFNFGQPPPGTFHSKNIFMVCASFPIRNTGRTPAAQSLYDG